MTTLLNKGGRFATAKRLAVCAAVAFLSVGAMAQMSDWEKLANMKDVEYIHLNKSMIEQETKNGNPVNAISLLPFSLALANGNNVIEGDKIGKALELMEDVQVFTCEESKSAAKFAKKVKALLKKGKYQSLMDVNDEDDMVKICQSQEGEKIRSIIFVEEKDDEDLEVTLVMIDGTLDLTKFMQ